MQQSLQIPVMKLFGKKVSQGLMEFNSFTSIMNMLVCDCGGEGHKLLHRIKCISRRRGARFCGDETVMQGSASKVLVSVKCPDDGRRRLSDSSVMASNLKFEILVWSFHQEASMLQRGTRLTSQKLGRALVVTVISLMRS